MTWNLFLQESLWSYLSPKANGMVVRHVDQILWSQTQASGDFWNFMLTEPTPINYLKSRKSWKTGIFFFFYRCREREKCQNILRLILKVVTIFFLPPPIFFGCFYQTSKGHKIITRRREDILRPVLESWRFILSKNISCINKISNFKAFLEPER